MNEPTLQKLKQFERKYEFCPYHPRTYSAEEIKEQTERDEQEAYDRGER